MATQAQTAPIGKSYPPVTYAVGREKIREYTLAVGETNPLHLDPEAAREAGHRDVVAPPMFCVVYCGPALGPALFDPQLGIDFAHLVHGGQEFEWGPLVVAGAEGTTPLTVPDTSSRGPLGFFTFETVSVNQDGHTVCVGTWTNIVRGL
jgi:acyl dehydratase